MPDTTLLIEKLEQISEALDRVKRRFNSIRTPDDFLDTPEGLDRLDAICMMLIAVGESLKKIDAETQGNLLVHYPGVDWKGVKGLRDVLSHNYFNIDAEEIFFICRNHIDGFGQAVMRILQQLRDGSSPFKP